jgi:hypothetical protein
VAGCFKNAQDDLPNRDLDAFFHRPVGKGRARFFAEDNLGSGARRELAMPAHEVGMEVL